MRTWRSRGSRAGGRALLRPLIGCCAALALIGGAWATSIKPADFDRLIMPCYLGAASSYAGAGQGNGFSSSRLQAMPASAVQLNGWGAPLGAQPARPVEGRSTSFVSAGAEAYAGRPGQQSLPRALTMENFIALVSKIEQEQPRLANQPDLLIRALLSRFRMDNYYYDTSSRQPISEQDHRSLDVVPALLNPGLAGSAGSQQFGLGADEIAETVLSHDEKCSMYFMLSHFVEKTASNQFRSFGTPVQLSGPQARQLPPSLQAAGSGYPALSAAGALSSAGSRFAGPSPGFGSPATSSMNSFGAGLSAQNNDLANPSQFGLNQLQPSLSSLNANLNNLNRNSGPYSGTLTSNARYPPPYIDGQLRQEHARSAREFGVVSLANQENAALVLNRVLMGLLGANMAPRPIRQYAELIYPLNSPPNTMRLDNEIDPLFALTLADLWALSAIPKPGRSIDIRSALINNGHWNDTMCPLSFQLERADQVRFTTAELIGGLDGLNLGLFRRRMLEMRKNLRLSEILRLYYSKLGFRPQFAEFGVCNRATALNSQMEMLRRQSEDYLRLYQLNQAFSDNAIVEMVARLDSFKDIVRQAANLYLPREICSENGPMNEQFGDLGENQCEIPKTDLVTVLDSSSQANEPFMRLVVTKLANKLGLARQGSSLSVLTNQQDSSGYSGANSFNAIINNSTNTAEIGCALAYDTSRSYSGGQITDQTRLMEMFERSLINLDSEYIFRQKLQSSQYSSGSSGSSSYQASSFGSTWFGSPDGGLYMSGSGPRTTGGSKVIMFFNFGGQSRISSLSNYPSNWNSPSYSDQSSGYRFQEAKRFLRENFRGAAILALSNNRDEVKPLVFSEERDIFTDLPQSDSQVSSFDYYPAGMSPDSGALAAMSGQADQLVGKLLHRICEVPALFQYPMCFRVPSENTASIGYISPQKKQYWMMSPKTFFASRSVRMLFKVEAGRLRVCFGRMPKPDESAQRSGQSMDFGGSSSISLSNGNPRNSASQSSSNGNNFYTGLEHGVCKDISPGQEIDFIVDDPCYKKPIAECEPFYFTIREISNSGEGDSNYMCRDEACKRFDQVKFTMIHTGVSCNSSFNLKANWLLIIIAMLISLSLHSETRSLGHSIMSMSKLMPLAIISAFLIVQQVNAQQAGVHDFGQGRYGEKRGNFTPSEVLSIVLLIMTIVLGLALTIGLCYYVAKKNSRGMTRVQQNDY